MKSGRDYLLYLKILCLADIVKLKQNIPRKPRISLHQIGGDCWTWSFDVSKSMKFAWGLGCCLWAWVLGRLEFFNPLLTWSKTKSIMIYKEEVFFKASEKTTCWFVVSIGCFTLGSFGKHLKNLKLVDLTVKAIFIDWLTLSIDWFFENITKLVKSVNKSKKRVL